MFGKPSLALLAFLRGSAGEELKACYWFDRYCLENLNWGDDLLGGRWLTSPWTHNVHCLIDVPQCYNSNFALICYNEERKEFLKEYVIATDDVTNQKKVKKHYEGKHRMNTRSLCVKVDAEIEDSAAINEEYAKRPEEKSRKLKPKLIKKINKITNVPASECKAGSPVDEGTEPGAEPETEPETEPEAEPETAPSDLGVEGVTLRNFGDADVEMHHGVNGDKVTLCCVNLKDGENGWCGVGPGTDMSDANVVVFGNKARDTGNAYELTKYGIVKKATVLGETDMKKMVMEEKFYGCYTMPLAKLKDGEASKFVVAAGKASKSSDVPSQSTKGNPHGSSKRPGVTLSGGSANNNIIIIHVFVMIAAFWLLYPAGALVAVYAAPGFKRGSGFFQAHRALMSLAILLMLVGAGLALSRSKFMINTVHGGVGCVVIALCLLQPINAAFRPGKDSPNRRKWEYLHKSAGRLGVLLGLVNTVLGGFRYAKDILKMHDTVDTVFVMTNPGIVAIVFASVMVVVYLGLRVRQYMSQGSKDDLPYRMPEPSPGTTKKKKKSTSSETESRRRRN